MKQKPNKIIPTKEQLDGCTYRKTNWSSTNEQMEFNPETDNFELDVVKAEKLFNLLNKKDEKISK